MAELDPREYTVAWIAPLEIEAIAATHMLDKRHAGQFAIGRGDNYIFTPGDIFGHNIIIASFPAGQECGVGSAAALANQVKKFFPNLWFGLLVGVAAGLPAHDGPSPRDIRLGDVLVALPEGDSAGLIAYGLGKETAQGFQLLRGGHALASTETVVRSAIGSIKREAPDDARLFLPFYQQMKNREHPNGSFIDPGQDADLLYERDDEGVSRIRKRKRRPDSQRTRVWYGPIGSGDRLVRNSTIRDELRNKYHVIGLEMEAAGTMNYLPVGVIRGVCDYADEHKNKYWQPYAAAMAAAFAKAILSQIRPRKGDILGTRKPVTGEVSHTILTTDIITTIEDSILVSLWYPAMQDREDMIHDASRATYEWLYCDPVREQKPWDNFNAFLKGDYTVYWITGKAGSGKSTLTKYILQNPRTLRCLRKWSLQTAPVIASFYFSYKGAILQKSSSGVLRGLLYQILSQRRDMIKDAFPERYRALCFDWTQGTTFEPTYKELKRSLEQLISTRPGDRFFLAVDGLDEHETDSRGMRELAHALKEFTRWRNAKVLLSSRPWVIFEDLFANCPRLRLHELTRPDIAKFVEKEIGGHPRIQRLGEADNMAMQQLMTEMVEASAGVFLWVYLVIHSLLEGLTNSDTVDELRQRFLELPTDLEGLYSHMWSKIPQRYQRPASRLLQLVGIGTADGAQLSLLGLSLEEENGRDAVFTTEIAPLDEQEVQSRLASMEARLNSCCIGLVEVYRSSRRPTVDTLTPTLNSDLYPNKLENSYDNPQAVFLHRTVCEFLSSPCVSKTLTELASGSNREEPFCAERALLCLLVLRIKTYRQDSLSMAQHKNSTFPTSLEALLYYSLRMARLAERRLGSAQTQLILELDKAMAKHYLRSRKLLIYDHWSNWLYYQGDVGEADVIETSPPRRTHDDLLSLAIRHGLVLFAQEQVSEKDIAKTRPGRPLLDYALRPFCTTWGLEKTLTLPRLPQMVKLLLENGEDPNQIFDGDKTPWRLFLDDLEGKLDLNVRADVPEIMHLLITHGAVVQISTTNGLTPLQICYKMQHRNVEEDLATFEANLDKLFRLLRTHVDLAAANKEETSLDGLGGLVPISEVCYNNKRKSFVGGVKRFFRK